ncbi:hypothetical protein LTR36_004335 [Oleoguttula mirabilis]|uniref:Uncharacterized protein n=1 Tax=Oleoguttula mirabilis TaxID=1507867 RepID=A0AAV9JHS7_9PEZI|nr:hypothetical protein LTR36_004335 [Oleoguttula mirabilis]
MADELLVVANTTTTGLASATRCSSTQTIASAALGTLVTLPPELRLLVFSHVVTADFRQLISFEGPHDALDSRQRSSAHHLSVLYASRALRQEAVESLMSDRVCKITIGLSISTTNFPLRDYLLQPGRQSEAVIFPTFTACKSLEIIVEIPYPRTAVDIATVRRNVRRVVALLNASGYALPRLHASLGGEHHESEMYTYNDYSMLLGPLSRLDNVRRGCVLCCSSPLTPGFVDPKCLQQCNLIEAAVTGDTEQRQKLLQQQCLFDIKLPLALYQDKEDLVIRFGSSKPQGHIGFDHAFNISQALQLLKAVTVGRPMLPWADDLDSTLTSKGGRASLQRSTVEGILGPYAVHEFLRWAAGHQTASNPYWQ